MTKIFSNADWRDRYGFEGDSETHPLTEDASILAILRDRGIRTAIVTPLRYPSMPSRLAERGILTIGIDDDSERLNQGRSEIQRRRTPGSICVAGRPEAMFGLVDLAVADTVSHSHPERLVQSAASKVRCAGLLIIISESSYDLNGITDWRPIEITSFRTARMESLITGVLQEEQIVIAERKQ